MTDRILTFAGWAAVLTLLGIGLVTDQAVPLVPLVVCFVAFCVDEYLHRRIKDD